MLTQRCPACGALNAEGAPVCSLCGKGPIADAAGPPQATAEAAPRLRSGQAARYVVPLGPALGLGALLGLGLFVLGERMNSRVTPMTALVWTLSLPPPIRFAGLSPFRSAVVAGIALGALVGWLTTRVNNRWIGGVLLSPLFMALRAHSFARYDAWFRLDHSYGLAGKIYLVCVVVLAGGWGAVYAGAIAGIIRSYSLEVFTRKPPPADAEAPQG